MCKHHQHRYRVGVRAEKGLARKDQDVVVYAIGVAEAIAKADGWAHRHLPGYDFYFFSIHRSSYHTGDEGAIEHGAILPQ